MIKELVPEPDRHPRTLRTTSPFSTRARAIAYWSPRTNPSVPSTGSKTQNLPVGPPVELHLLMASRTSLVSRLVTGGVMPKADSEDSELLTVSTTDDRRVVASAFERASVSSSATMDTFWGPNA
ncbi:hypothetical protein CTI12_AA405360 [Artemisia annua]|uniref:Uncharacterized protein n=1 Tax=Artemisia annua TaxID=35608 RepID=A0A2U1M9F8_ARTAN|nr:hypothetical protein CTI12_AA405360 [Artemisia annua]